MIPLAPSPRELFSGAFSGSHVSTTSNTELLTDSVFSILHDLKNPLWGIRMSSQLLRATDDMHCNIHEVADDIRTSCDQIFALLQNLHELYTLDSTAQPIPYEDTHIPSVMSLCLDQHKATAEHKEIQLHIEMHGADTCTANTNAASLSRILCNLVSNAIKFTPCGKNVYVSVRETEANVICRITDEGPGFTEQDLAVLYEKFAMRSAVPTNGELSSRLGLAIVKILADRIGIGITLVTRIDVGSTFTLSIPKQRTDVDTTAEDHCRELNA
ncbi:MAG: HAMP domain-containing histidine kinase [Candidatus Kapabacteria bacterium]|nr:HAMP domain-containing histidine kinase [Candidatus Kapabacteria bacterium]